MLGMIEQRGEVGLQYCAALMEFLHYDEPAPDLSGFREWENDVNGLASFGGAA